MRGPVRVGRERQMTASGPPARRCTSGEQKKRDDLLNSGKDAAEISSTLQRHAKPFMGDYSAPLQKADEAGSQRLELKVGTDMIG